MSKLIAADMNIVRHTLGADSKRPGYRNRYVAGDDSLASLERLVAAGLMEEVRQPSWIDGRCFRATAAGMAACGVKEVAA